MTAPRRRHLVDRDWRWSPLNRPPAILDRDAGRLAPDARRRICLYGCGYGASCAPLDDPTWQVWTLNVIPPLDREGRIRADLWWDIHARSAQSDDDLAWFRALPVPLVTTADMLDDVGPHALRYPIERIEADVGPGPWACTFAYQIAYAMWAGYRQIGLFGIELAYGDRRERTVEWASVNWWIGYGVAHGVLFWLPPGSRLGQHPHRYGLEYDAEIADVTEYVAQMKQFDQTEDARKEKRAGIGG